MTSLAFITLAYAGLAVAFTWMAIAVVMVERRAADSASSSSRRLFVLRPVEHLETQWVERIARESEATREHATTVVASPHEDATHHAMLARAGVRIVTSRPQSDVAANRKVVHLAAAAASVSRLLVSGESATFVQVDADVLLEPDDLRVLRRTLDQGGEHDIAFAVPAPRSSDARSLGALALQAILALSPQAFAMVDALAARTRGAPAVAGKFLAISRETLAAIGGYASIERVVADDVALIERVRALGGTARRSPRAVAIDVAHVTLRTTHARMVRWLRVIRGRRARLLVTYPFFVAPLPTVGLASLGTSIATGSAWHVVPFAVLLLSRGALALALARGPYRDVTRSLRPSLPLYLVLGDALLLSALVLALLDRRIEWAGRVYDVDSSGTIIASRERAPKRA